MPFTTTEAPLLASCTAAGKGTQSRFPGGQPLACLPSRLIFTSELTLASVEKA